MPAPLPKSAIRSGKRDEGRSEGRTPFASEDNTLGFGATPGGNPHLDAGLRAAGCRWLTRGREQDQGLEQEQEQHLGDGEAGHARALAARLRPARGAEALCMIWPTSWTCAMVRG